MKIEVLYPELCNLYGELMNAEYLAKCCGAELVGTPLKTEPAFAKGDVALVYMGATTERGQTLVKESLEPWLPAIRERTEAGGVTLFTGNALEVLGEAVYCENGMELPMLNVFPTRAVRKLRERHNSFYIGRLENMDVVGFKSQFGHSYGEAPGLFETVRGVGLNPDVSMEGLRLNNLMATYLIGPLLVLNPPFTKYILRLMGVEEPTLPFEDAAMDVYRTHLREFSDPKIPCVY